MKMRIILKFLLRNIKEKKIRTMLIIFSITLSTALLFSTMAISGTVEKMFTDKMTKYTGTAEIMIKADSQSITDPFFTIKESDNEKIDYLMGVIEDKAFYEDVKNIDLSVLIFGYQLEDLLNMHDLELKEQENGSFDGLKAIIGENAALKNNISLGDEIELDIKGEKHSFTVYAISNSEGLFDFDGLSMSIVLPRNTIATIYEDEGKVNTIYVKTKDKEDVSSVIKDLSIDYEDLVVKTTVTSRQIDENIKSITSVFSLMLIVVIFISTFIIYTSFKVITLERLPIVGTFRSIGATKKMTDIILLGESIIYGIIGGLFGCILGFGILKIMINKISYNPYTGIREKVLLIYGIEHILFAFLGAVLLAIISALIPIIKVSKLPVRNIVLNNIRQVSKKAHLRVVVAFVLLFLPIIFLLTNKKSASLLLGIICLVLLGGAIIMFVPVITKLSIYIFEKINEFIFGNEGIIATKNIKNNKNIINNITLLTIGIASLLMVNTVSQSVAKEVLNVFSDAKFELVLAHPKADEEVVNRLENIGDVESVLGYYQVRDVKIKEKNDYIGFIWGINAKEYFDYWDYEIQSNQDNIVEEFNDGRNAIVPVVLKEKYGLKLGDSLTLSMKKHDVEYKITGFITTIMNNGDFIYIPDTFLKQDANIHYMSDIMIKTNKDPKEVSLRISEEFDKEFAEVLILDEEQDKNMESNNQMFMLLNGFSIIAMIIGIFGVFNNFVVSLMSRKRSIAVYRSIGMDKRQVFKMLFVESFTGGIIGGLSGIMGGLLFILLASYITRAISVPISMYLSIDLFVYAIVSGIIVSVLASILPAIRASKLSIIESIKYE